ncbi:hypothetical protein R1flu_009741 [Riccia fluitans]|uniref:Uncharacterized protein n=1 Tax=Riccia fluitans TaxID=41844 RepID=A0ABD1Z5I6_9MARC
MCIIHCIIKRGPFPFYAARLYLLQRANSSLDRLLVPRSDFSIIQEEGTIDISRFRSASIESVKFARGIWILLSQIAHGEGEGSREAQVAEKTTSTRASGMIPFNGIRRVSRHQVVVELLRPSSRKGKEVVGQSPGLKLQVQVVGRNPVCILNRQERRNPEVKFLCTGQKDWLVAGDKVSLSIKRPFFYELRLAGQSSPGSGEATLDTKANFNGNEKVPEKRNGDYSKFDEMDEEAGIAEAVARRQRRKLEREGGTDNSVYSHHRRIGESVQKKRETEETRSAEDKVAGQSERDAQKISSVRAEEVGPVFEEEDKAVRANRTRDEHSFDPVADFGFIVEGAEFSAFDKTRANNSVWRPEIGEGRGAEDDISDEEEMTSGRGGLHGLRDERTGVKKSRGSQEDEEWGGDNEEENDRLKIIAEKKGQTKMATRRTGPKSTTNTRKKSEGGSTNRTKRVKEDSDEDSDGSAGSLDDFIVDDRNLSADTAASVTERTQNIEPSFTIPLPKKLHEFLRIKEEVKRGEKTLVLWEDLSRLRKAADSERMFLGGVEMIVETGTLLRVKRGAIKYEKHPQIVRLDYVDQICLASVLPSAQFVQALSSV